METANLTPPRALSLLQSPRRITILAVGVLVAAALLAYANTFGVPLLLDDIAAIAGNPSIRQLWPLSSVLTPPADVGLGGRPLANLSFALNYGSGGTAVAGYHAVNLAIHLAAALALFGGLRRTFALPTMESLDPKSQQTMVAFGISLIWLLHPLQTESVTYLAQRTESLMGLWYLLSLYTFIRGATGSHRGWQAAAVGFCLCGMATKEVMVTAPAIIFLYDRTFLAGSFRSAWRQRKAVHLALAATWLLLLGLLVDVHERGIGYTTVTAWQYALTSSFSILHYLRLAFWPNPLVFDYGSTMLRTWSEAWPYVTALGILISVTALAVARSPRLGFALAWVLILLSPTTSFVPVAAQPLAEHRMYLPLIGVVAIVVVGLVRHFGARCGWALPLVAVTAGYATFDRNRDYASALTLWSDTVAKAPMNSRAHASLGAALLEQGKPAAAIPALQTALKLEVGTAEAHNNLAMALVDVGRVNEALAHFARAVELRPNVASTRYNFGNALLQLGRIDEAITQQQQALVLQPDLAEAHCALGSAFAAGNRLDVAIASYQTGIRLQPGLVAGQFGLANALAQSGRLAESIPHFEATIQGAPNVPAAHSNFGSALLALGRHSEAVRAFETVLKLQPDSAAAHFQAANALALSGKLAESITHYETALKLKPDLAAARANLEAVRRAIAQPR